MKQIPPIGAALAFALLARRQFQGPALRAGCRQRGVGRSAPRPAHPVSCVRPARRRPARAGDAGGGPAEPPDLSGLRGLRSERRRNGRPRLRLLQPQLGRGRDSAGRIERLRPGPRGPRPADRVRTGPPAQRLSPRPAAGLRGQPRLDADLGGARADHHRTRRGRSPLPDREHLHGLPPRETDRRGHHGTGASASNPMARSAPPANRPCARHRAYGWRPPPSPTGSEP